MLTRDSKLRGLVLAIAGSILIPSLAVAEEEKKDDWLPGEFSANVSVTTDYQFRGISQTDHKPALQGGIDYSIETGLLGISAYAGVWGSNVDFQDGDNATVELDWAFGLSGDIAETGVGWSLGGLYYSYPGAGKSGGQHLNYDYWEIPVTLTYSPHEYVSLSGGYNYSPDFFAGSGTGNYISGGVSITPPIPWFGLSIDGRLGYQWIESNSTFGAEDYLDYSIGVTATIKEHFNVGVAFAGTNLSRGDCFGHTDLCEGRFIGTIGASF